MTSRMSVEATKRKQESVVFKVTQAVIVAAIIAAIITLLTGTSDPLVASPVAATEHAAMKACTQQPWPYLNCVGTPYGNPKVRLIEIK
ncbi:MAG: hypothetical protein Q7T81_13720 [Pseudolabrys sp.]|nr:hypothetical protein [Pseudolabrys sp.]